MMMIGVSIFAQITDTIPYKTGYAYDDRCTTYYQNGTEVPQRVSWINQRLQQQGLIEKLVPITPVADPLTWISKVHTADHIKNIQSIPVDSFNGATQPIGVIAELAAGYVLGAVRDVMEGKVTNAFAAIRPPGHHVTNEGFPVGFCAYANVVIAARYAADVYNVKRILFIDWDYHYGNGTEFFICKDNNSFLLEFGYSNDSSSNCNAFSNHIINRAVGNGTNDDYEKVLTEYLSPKMAQFQPELIIISCGFDLKKMDGLGAYNVTAQGISKLTKKVMDIANSYSQGRVVSILEGGYCDRGSLPNTFYGLSQCAENHVRTLLTGKIQEETPFFIEEDIQNNIKNIPQSPRYMRNGILKLAQEMIPLQSVTMYDFHGRLIWTQNQITRPTEFNLQRYGSPGVYVIKIKKNNGNTLSFPALLKR
jgi:acetoin utilization deacetylase AcuC-like enzyme